MDNFAKNCPARMSDGRIFGDFRTSVAREEYVKYINGIVRDDHHRIFYQQNADTIMDNEFNQHKKKSCTVPKSCVHQYPTRVFPPWMIEERTNYNKPHSQRPTCEKRDDYRLNK